MEREDIKQLAKEVRALSRKIDALSKSSTIPFNVHKAFADRLQISKFPVLEESVAEALGNAPLATISDPAGGAVIDSQARSAIGTIIDRLQALGLIS